jgi:hypothetical protein
MLGYDHDLMSQGSFPELSSSSCYPVHCLYLQLNPAFRVKQEHLPGTDWRQPQFVLFILKFLLDPAGKTPRFLQHPYPNVGV